MRVTKSGVTRMAGAHGSMRAEGRACAACSQPQGGRRELMRVAIGMLLAAAGGGELRGGSCWGAALRVVIGMLSPQSSDVLRRVLRPLKKNVLCTLGCERFINGVPRRPSFA
jgi:hypothetical protein